MTTKIESTSKTFIYSDEDEFLKGINDMGENGWKPFHVYSKTNILVGEVTKHSCRILFYREKQ